MFETSQGNEVITLKVSEIALHSFTNRLPLYN